MKKKWLAVIVLILLAFGIYLYYNQKIGFSPPPKINPNYPIIPGTNSECTGACYNCLIDAIKEVESGSQKSGDGEPDRGQCNAIGDDGKACGPYQIWEGYYNDARKACLLPGGKACCALNNYDYSNLCDECGNDACCEEKERMSKLAMACYARLYTKNGKCAEGHGKDGKFTCEDLARIHNGGPCGHNSGKTDEYWDKVKNQMAKTCPICIGIKPGLNESGFVDKK